jgi:hypothetical protein
VVATVGFRFHRGFFCFRGYILVKRECRAGARIMQFSEKSRPVGRLEIIKIDKRTGLEEVVYDESNVITGGLGRSIAQLMSTTCNPHPCDDRVIPKVPTSPQAGIDFEFID